MKSSSLRATSPAPNRRAPESLTVGFRPSRLAVLWLSLVGLAAVCACWLLPWPPEVAVTGCLLVVLWYGWSLRRHALGAWPVQRLRWADGWALYHRGQWQPAQLCSAAVWPPMAFLRFRGHAGTVVCWLPPDRAEPQSLRRLRVILRHSSSL